MQIKVFRFTGLTPLLMSNIESVNRDAPTLKLGTKPNKGDIEKIAEAATYRDTDGSLYLPTQALRSSLLDGCSGQKVAGTRIGPRKIFQGVLFCSEDRATLLNPKSKPITEYEIQIDSGVNKANKARIIVVRPRIDEWHVDVPFEIDDEFAPTNFEQFLDTVLSIWNRAGRAVGAGAWRPQNSGRFGRYSVEMVGK